MTANPNSLGSNIQLQIVVLTPESGVFPVSFMGEIVFNAELKSTNVKSFSL